MEVSLSQSSPVGSTMASGSSGRNNGDDIPPWAVELINSNRELSDLTTFSCVDENLELKPRLE